MKKDEKTSPGEGLRSLKTSSLFRTLNFELYVKPNLVVMVLGCIAMTGCVGYIAYMRKKYADMGYYAAITEDGSEQFVKKKSNWD